MKIKFFFFLVLMYNPGTTLYSQVSNKAKTSAAGYYEMEMLSLQKTIRKHFYDSVSGYYKEVPQPAKNHNPFSYLWPLCAMFQAAHEIESINRTASLTSGIINIIEDYYDPAPPGAGFASYILELKGGDRFYDDNQWIGITSMDAYFKNKNKADLQRAKIIYDYMMTGYDTVLSGGIYWQEKKKISKNTCSNGPGIILALQLYKATRNRSYLDTALLIYNWTNRYLRAPSGLYYDNISVNSRRVDKRIYSYNTGTMLQANVYLYELTGDKRYLQRAIAIADSSALFFYGNGKFKDNYWFNAVLLRAYQHLFQYHKHRSYILAFKTAVDHALKYEKNQQGLFVQREKVRDLVAHAGMLEILARFAFLEKRYSLN